MTKDFQKTTRTAINNGDFSLSHDTVLKVYQDNGVQYFTCESRVIGMVTAIISQLNSVHSVIAYPIDDFES